MIRNYCEKLHFPEDAIPVMEQTYSAILESEKGRALLAEAVQKFLEPGQGRDGGVILAELSAQMGIRQETTDMVALLAALEPMPDRYRKAGLPEELLWASMEDLTYKLYECRDVRHCWGTFVTWWFTWFYELKRFKLGRLEYESVEFEYEEYRGWKKGDKVINLHIPSDGPLTREAVMASLKQAYDFYRDCRKDGKLLFICHSWLLYPEHYRRVFPVGSNLRGFYELFDLIDMGISENNHDFWRVFNMDYSPEILDQVPTDTRLRRNLLQFVKSGRPMGEGAGIICFDGEQIL